MQTTKYSRQRETLLEVLRSTTCHPDADWIYGMVREKIPKVSLGTVYRNLAKLSAEGIIRKIEVGDGSLHFDGDLSPHSHLVCNGCGKILDIFTDYAEMLKDDAEEKTNALVCDCSVIFHGVCKECK